MNINICLQLEIHKANIRHTKEMSTILSDAFWKYLTIKIIVADKGYRGMFAGYVGDNENCYINLYGRYYRYRIWGL